MSANTSKARPKGQAAKAARAEKQKIDKPKVIDWRELKLELSPQLPAAFAFDLVLIEKANDAGPYLRVLNDVFGDEQFVLVRNKLTRDDNLNDVVVELVNAVFEAYGLTLGESSASQDS